MRESEGRKQGGREKGRERERERGEMIMKFVCCLRHNENGDWKQGRHQLVEIGAAVQLIN